MEYVTLDIRMPEYYGGNLDAFYDVLTDIHEDTCIRLLHSNVGDEEESYCQRLKQVLLDAEEQNCHLYLEI